MCGMSTDIEELKDAFKTYGEGISEDEDNFSDSVSDTLSEGGGGDGSDVGLQAALLNSVWTVLNRVIMLGVADAEVEVRHSIFANLSANTDQFILRSNTLSLVYQAVHDEAFTVREKIHIFVVRKYKNSHTLLLNFSMPFDDELMVFLFDNKLIQF